MIGKIADGIGDDLLTTVLLATRAPVVIAPAMNVNMWENPIVQANLNRLRAGGFRIVEPGEGFLACGWEGKGRLADLDVLLAEIERALSPQDLRGERVLVTAGPNREPIDPVRFISNRSTGKMGFAVAAAAWRRGAEVTLVAGPTALPTPHGVRRCDVTTAEEMRQAVVAEFDDRLDAVHGRRGRRLPPGARRQGEAEEGQRTADPRARPHRRHPRGVGAPQGQQVRRRLRRRDRARHRQRRTQAVARSIST